MAQPNSPYTTSVDLLKAAGVSSLAVASTGFALSQSWLLKPNRSFAIEIQAAVSSGTPDIKVELQSGGSAPDTEGSVDTDFTVPRALGGGVNQDCIIDSSINTVLVRFYPLPPVVSPYQRLLFTGQNSNPASATITRLIIHEINS